MNLFFYPLQLLISKLEKNKAMKAEDKAKIMETLGMLTKSITKLQEEIKGISSSNNPLRTAKSKAEVVAPVQHTDKQLYTAYTCLGFINFNLKPAMSSVLM